jgi:hypothetical protein
VIARPPKSTAIALQVFYALLHLIFIGRHLEREFLAVA